MDINEQQLNDILSTPVLVAKNNIDPDTPCAIQESTTSDCISNKSTEAENTSNGDNDDIISAPRLVIFVSGLSADLTHEKLTKYISKRIDISTLSGFHVHKLKVDPTRGYSSFKICTGRNQDVFNKILDPKFWPEDVVVHKHFWRDPKIGYKNTSQ